MSQALTTYEAIMQRNDSITTLCLPVPFDLLHNATRVSPCFTYVVSGLPLLALAAPAKQHTYSSNVIHAMKGSGSATKHQAAAAVPACPTGSESSQICWEVE